MARLMMDQRGLERCKRDLMVDQIIIIGLHRCKRDLENCSQTDELNACGGMDISLLHSDHCLYYIEDIRPETDELNACGGMDTMSYILYYSVYIDS